ncbi:MAG: HPr kinase/phosphatase C-terminal domain-containing protein [Proteobacteria bacterium]|nr:HPr kinase/phosphatase C-terminal domain-containing protein [Pseudomonadota bacterium]
MIKDAGSSIHATAVVLGEQAVLITGASGTGKSRLARRLIALVRERGGHAALIGDDRIHLTCADGRLVARGHSAIRGLLEVRGVGILPMPHALAGVVTLVVQLDPDAAPRLPEPDAHRHLAGLRLPLLRLAASSSSEDNARLVLAHPATTAKP